MATLTVRHLNDDLVRRPQVRAAERGRSAEAEHREILRLALIGNGDGAPERRRVADRLADFRRRTAGRGPPSVMRLLRESRAERIAALIAPERFPVRALSAAPAAGGAAPGATPRRRRGCRPE
ncbi:MAG: FitA-like ribbon-helix-helix domain-containing protein [Acetobacteraceae bacterium]